MCTLSWIVRHDGYDIFFSRDERRTRGPAAPPRPDTRAGVRFIAPRDGDQGGSWIVANELGVTLCMLNLYLGPAPARSGGGGEFVSRGLLALAAADAPTPRAVVERITHGEPSLYRPFSAVAFAPGRGPRLVQWDGVRLVTVTLTEAQCPYVSSGYDLDGVRRARRAQFRDLLAAAGGRLQAADLERYHRSHAPTRGPYSACMHREDASTVSLTRVQVGPEAVYVWYAGGQPCETSFAPPDTLARCGPPVPSAS